MFFNVSRVGAGACAVVVAARLVPERREPRHRRPQSAACQEVRLEGVARTLLKPSIQYAELHGLVYARQIQHDTLKDKSLATQCPVAMVPFKVPAKAFEESVTLSPLWNKLVDAVARDRPWLYATLEGAAKADPFTGRLVALSKAVHAKGLRQPIMLGIHRSDYMLHESGDESPKFLQVELNTIASSMASHSHNALTLHRFVLGRYGTSSDSVGRTLQEHFGVNGNELVKHLPENMAMKAIPSALAAAQYWYGVKGAVVLMVVDESERNFADQRWIEYGLWEQHGIPMVRKSLTQIQSESKMDPDTGRLRLGDGSEVAVVYFRAGYSPDCYPTEKEWDARELLETSLAIKCPSIDYQLVGAKKVQQALARPGAVEHFMGARDAVKLRTCFAGLWGLGPGENDDDIIQQVHKDPTNFVMKPQREGGGHNFYGQDVSKKLRELTAEERGAYILMQRILPRTQESVMTRAGQASVLPAVSEFGFYSTYLGDGRKVHLSQHAGHLVRTKADGVDEGGVAAGFAVISSPFLVK